MKWFFSRYYLFIALGAAILSSLIALPASLNTAASNEAMLAAQLKDYDDKIKDAETKEKDSDDKATRQQGVTDAALEAWKPVSARINTVNTYTWDFLGKLAEERNTLVLLQDDQIQRRDALAALKEQKRKLEDDANSNKSGTTTGYYFALYAVIVFSLFIGTTMAYCFRLFNNPNTKRSVAANAKEIYNKGWTILEATYIASLLYLGLPIIEGLKALHH